MDLRAHSMFSSLYSSKAPPSAPADSSPGPWQPRHRDRVRLRVMKNQLNNTHLSDRHVRLRTERELLACRQETFSSFADVGIECPLLLTPTVKIHRTPKPRRQMKTDLLTLSWNDPAPQERTPYVDADLDSDDGSSPVEWEQLLAQANRSKSVTALRPTSRKNGEKPSSSQQQQQQLQQQEPRPKEETATRAPTGPRFNRYAIGSLPRPPPLDFSSQRVRQVGVRVRLGAREATMPPDRPRPDLSPVATALRRLGTCPERIRWRPARSGELNVSKVWSRELSDFDTRPVIQIAREDTRHLVL